jgi:hypothetical protein
MAGSKILGMFGCGQASASTSSGRPARWHCATALAIFSNVSISTGAPTKCITTTASAPIAAASFTSNSSRQSSYSRQTPVCTLGPPSMRAINGMRPRSRLPERFSVPYETISASAPASIMRSISSSGFSKPRRAMDHTVVDRYGQAAAIALQNAAQAVWDRCCGHYVGLSTPSR